MPDSRSITTNLVPEVKVELDVGRERERLSDRGRRGDRHLQSAGEQRRRDGEVELLG